MVEGGERAHDTASVASLVNDKEWLTHEFVKTVQERGKAVIDKRGASSAASAASAIVDNVRDWWCGTQGEIVSMGVWTDGSSYGIADGLIFSLPVTIDGNGRYTIVRDLSIDAFSRAMLDKTEQELKEERALALAPPAAASTAASS